jgi:hypothetical protein
MVRAAPLTHVLHLFFHFDAKVRAHPAFQLGD